MQQLKVADKAGINAELDSFESYHDELVTYLTSRFGSLAFAERICSEVRARLAGSDILSLVGNPRVYLSGYGLSLGAQFLVEEQHARNCTKGVLL